VATAGQAYSSTAIRAPALPRDRSHDSLAHRPGRPPAVQLSLTQVLDKPVTERIFVEKVIRANLDIGRPDNVGLIFGRRIIRKRPRATPGRFRTRILTEGVDHKHPKVKRRMP
jgi:hypothetical protein